MGATNVKLAYALWGGLPATPLRALVFMALTSLDKDNERTRARLYYGGREAIAVALGREMPPEPADDDMSPAAVEARRVRHVAIMAVYRALKKLTDARAIEVIRKGRPGRYGMYALNLDPFPSNAQRYSEVTLSDTEVTLSVTGNNAERSPYEKQEPLEEPGTGQPHLERSPHHARATPPGNNDEYRAATKTLKRIGTDQAQQ